MVNLPIPASPAASRPQLHTQRSRALAVPDEVFEAHAAEEKKKPPVGVLPNLDLVAHVPSMSLGTPPFCNDRPSPAPPSEFAQGITGVDGSTPIACIEWNRVTFYREAIRSNKPRQKSLFAEQNLTRGTFNGYMSPSTRRKVRRIVSTWIRSIMIYRAEVKRKYDPGRAYPVFVTLTLPSDQVHSDAEINRKCLQPFIQRLRRDYEVENYFWRAEAQENGRLHIHMLVDRYIPKRYLQLAWNMSVEALGYLTRYYEASGSLTPPSTEVHRIRDKVRDKKTGKWKSVDPVDYLLDYVMDTPTPEGEEPEDPNAEAKPKKLVGRIRHADGTVETYTTRPITGRVWGMSDTLRDIREPRAEATVGMVHALEEAKQRGILKRIDLEHATLYFGPVGLVLSRASLKHWRLVQGYYLQVFGHLYPAQLPPEYLRDHPPQDPRNLWIDFDEACTYHRLRMEGPSPVFETAAELDQWVAEQATQQPAQQQRA